MEEITSHNSGEVSETRSPNFWKAVLIRFKKNKLGKFALRFVIFLAFLAIFADFIAYRKPIVCKMNDTVYFPVIYDYLHDWGIYKWDADLILADWKEMDFQWAIWPPVRYNPEELDYSNIRAIGPFGEQKVDQWQKWHFLGTNDSGRDVLSGLIHGTRISLTMGIVAMGIAFFIGIIMGSMAGYWGDNRLQLTNAGIFLGIIGLILGFFYGFQVRSYVLLQAISNGPISFLIQFIISLVLFFGIIILMVQISRLFNWIPWLNRKRFVWVDIIISRIIEIFNSIPGILLIITLMAISETKSIYTIMIIMGLIGWTGVARFIRAEMLRVRGLEYILAARSLGFGEFRIIFRHALPNTLAPVLVVMAFGVAGVIVTEAALSFLGIGVPDDTVTWGGLLRDAHANLNAWWLSIFPAIAMFSTVTALNILGDSLRDALDPTNE